MSKEAPRRRRPLVILADTRASALWLARKLPLSHKEFRVATEPRHLRGLHGFPYMVVCDAGAPGPTAEKVYDLVRISEQRLGYEVDEAQVIARAMSTSQGRRGDRYPVSALGRMANTGLHRIQALR